MVTFNDGGYRGRMVSLAGVVGREGYGLQVTESGIVPGFGVATDVISPNANRVWLIVTNLGTDVLYIHCGRVTAPSGFALQVNGTLQFDVNLPWTGGLSMYSNANIVAYYAEASLAGA